MKKQEFWDLFILVCFKIFQYAGTIALSYILMYAIMSAHFKVLANDICPLLK